MNVATRYQHITDPTVLELLRLMRKPGIISFAGGTPHPDTFPQQLLETHAASLQDLLQYSPTDGLPEYKQTLAEQYSHKLQMDIQPDNILITNGSQQALDIIARTYINSQDTIAIEDPSYFVALYAFGAYEPRYETLDLDASEEITAKLGYVIPNFQNPTSTVLSHEQRLNLAQRLSDETLLIEDDPYGELYFAEKPPAAIYTHNPKQVLYISSLSKVMAPALRNGIIIADPDRILEMTLVKQGMDICTSAVTQGIANRVLQDARYVEHMSYIRSYYKQKASVMQHSLVKHLSSIATWNEPAGGMFFWLTLSQQLQSDLVAKEAVKAGVSIVPGAIFSHMGNYTNSIRLSFAHPSESDIVTGVERLSEAIHSMLQ